MDFVTVGHRGDVSRDRLLQVAFQWLPNRLGHDQRSQQEDRLLGVIQVRPGVTGLVEVDQMHGGAFQEVRSPRGADDPQFLRLLLLVDNAQLGKSEKGDYTIPAGQMIAFRYRVVLHDGDTKAAAPGQLFDGYARPPTLELEKQ